MAGDEPVTSPDQHRPTVSKRMARLGLLLTIILLVVMTIGNHEGQVENVWLLSIAAVLFLTLIVDFALRRNGLKND